MSTQAFTTVRTARTQIEAGLFISVLQQAGLHPLESNSASHFSVAGVDIDYAVQVPTVELAEAKEVLTAYDTNTA